MAQYFKFSLESEVVTYIGRSKALVSDFSKYVKFESEGQNVGKNVTELVVDGYTIPVHVTSEEPSVNNINLAVKGYFILPR